MNNGKLICQDCVSDDKKMMNDDDHFQIKVSDDETNFELNISEEGIKFNSVEN
jgi:hypothetical protein